jgi:hypothetical protein
MKSISLLILVLSFVSAIEFNWCGDHSGFHNPSCNACVLPEPDEHEYIIKEECLEQQCPPLNPLDNLCVWYKICITLLPPPLPNANNCSNTDENCLCNCLLAEMIGQHVDEFNPDVLPAAQELVLFLDGLKCWECKNERRICNDYENGHMLVDFCNATDGKWYFDMFSEHRRVAFSQLNC